MAHLPLLEELEISGFGMFPGFERNPVDLTGSLTLILGANGIGKSTLVQILFRMFTGPFDIPGATGPSLGRANLNVAELSRPARRIFADRVSNASESTARIRFSLGSVSFEVSRSLSNLSLIEASVSTGEAIDDELALQQAIQVQANVGSFSDFILLLRYVVFYREDRHSLIWDPAAQKQILRPLFLEAADSNHWVEQERSILRLDSQRRNLSAVIYQSSEFLRREVAKSDAVSDVLRRIQELNVELASLEEDMLDTTDLLADADLVRSAQREKLLQAQDDLEASKSAYERARIGSIAARLPETSTTARYLLAQLVSNGSCAGCGNSSEALEMEFERRSLAGECHLCGHAIRASGDTVFPDATDAMKAGQQLTLTNDRVEGLLPALRDAEDEYNQLNSSLRERRRRVLAINDELAQLNSLLPDEDLDQAERGRELLGLRRQLSILDSELEERRTNFESSMSEMTRSILGRARELSDSFSKYASQFLSEESRLTWSPRMERVGQLGAQIAFPNFTLEMSGSDFSASTIRNADSAVSESQKEFIDLSFRMALVEIAGAGAASLIIDSPDYSLDAVFEPKAADALSRYMENGPRSRIITTSNLSSGEFVPKLVNNSRDAGLGEPTLVDLFDLAVPTAAVKQNRAEYLEYRDRTLTRAGIEAT